MVTAAFRPVGVLNDRFWRWSQPIEATLYLRGKGCDECVDFLQIRTLAAGVDARTGGVTDPQYNLVRPRRVVDQHRGRIKGIEIPTLVEGRMYHRSAMFEVASDANQRRLGVGAQLRWARAKCRQRRLDERSPELSEYSIRGLRSAPAALPASGFSNTAAIATRRSGGLAGAPYSLLISSTRVTVLRMVMMCSLF
jgi:hypothetical protein